jgi:hypothetical protein
LRFNTTLDAAISIQSALPDVVRLESISYEPAFLSVVQAVTDCGDTSATDVALTARSTEIRGSELAIDVPRRVGFHGHSAP